MTDKIIIQKRNQTEVEFDILKIIKAIESAMRETEKGIDTELSNRIASSIEKELSKNKSKTVDEISDMVEQKLMTSNRKDVAKQYILYRENRNKTRDQKNFNLLTDEFISQYKHKPNPMTPLGEFVYYRTYSRWIPEEERREYWWETVRRTVEYNCSLVEGVTREEAENLYDNIFNLRQFLSGRTLWVGGTPIANEYGTSNFNCFSKDTEFLTKQGLLKFSDFNDGDIVEVLNGNGAWSKSIVKNYGKEELLKLTLRRGNTKTTKEIYVTPDHIWFIHGIDRYIQVKTSELKYGDILRNKKRYENTKLNTCNIGIQHGIVFGDGTYDIFKNHCRISLIGNKQNLIKYFTTGTQCTEGNRDSTLIYGLPYYWKELPPIDANPEYLKGFIIGLLATDAGISSSICLVNKDKSTLQHIRSIAETIGLTTSDVKEIERKNKNFGDYANCYSLYFHKENFTDDMILNLNHKSKFSKSEKHLWKVESVEKTSIIENVWCVEEPITQSFTLASGIHTHNCSFCIIDEFSKFKELFYLLMVGAGVGFRILQSDVNKLPKIRTNIQVVNKDYVPVYKYARQESTSLEFRDKTAYITIGDSKEGWTQALDYFFKLFSEKDYKYIQTLIINYDNIRGKGEKLKKFGGTASGHEHLQIMFTKLTQVIHNLKSNQNDNEYKKLRPIHCMDICNIIGENVVSGGVRRTSEICLIDQNDKEAIQAKNNLYYKDEEGWKENLSLSHRRMSNNSIVYFEKPSYEQLVWQIQQMRNSGEPAFMNMEAARKRRSDCEGTNPCFTGDMKLLTAQGYKTFEELNNNTFEIINSKNEISQGKVWATGEKETIKLIFSNKNIITCTPDHVFMTIDQAEYKAKDLHGQKIMPYLSSYKTFNPEYIKYGYIQGDGDLGRLKSTIHRGLEVNIGNKDNDIFNLFKNDQYTTGRRKIYLQGYNDELNELGFSSEQLPNRCFPTTYNEWSLVDKASFLQGCYSANGSIIKNARISYKTTCKEFANQLLQTLKNDFSIKAYITTNRPKTVKFTNGEYLCKTSYDVNISRYGDIQKFCLEINFYHDYKKIMLKELLLNRCPYVMSIQNNGVQQVYDFSEPKEHWGIVEGFIAHNCGEILLRDRGLCNLTTVNLSSFVKDEILDKEALFEAQRMSARAGVRMTCLELELHQWDMVQSEDRLLGCSLSGIRDAMDILNYSVDEENELLAELKEIAHSAAYKYAEELSIPKPLLITTIKPEGTQSTVAGISNGLHYPHSQYYIRRVRISAHDPLIKVCEELEYPVYPEVGQDIETCSTKVIEFPVYSPAKITKYDVSAIKQLENYKNAMQYYVDHNASITVSVRSNEWDDVTEWLWNNWDDVVAVSFLPLEDSFYNLMPYESINKEEYECRVSEMKPFRPSLLSKYELVETEIDVGQSECTGGACPIR